jgi:hypothetical protein
MHFPATFGACKPATAKIFLYMAMLFFLFNC